MTGSSQTPASDATSSHFSSSQSVVSSALSSLPSGLFPPTVGSNPAEADESEDGIPSVFLAKKKTRSSHVWRPENGEEIVVRGEGRWKCNRCSNPKNPTTFSLSSTKNAIAHLKKVHRINANGPIPGGPSEQQQTIEAAFGKAAPSITFNEDIFRHLLLRYIYTTSESFRVCEEDSFRTLLSYLAACKPNYTAIHRALPHSGTTIRRHLVAFYKEMKAEVKKKLRRTEVKIHFSFDMWSGPNHHAYQAVVAHWLDERCKLHAALLFLHRFEGAHSGVNQAEHVWKTLEEYEIQHVVGKFNVDNASNNDTALRDIARRLTAAGYPTIDPVADRLRCFGHVLNLAVKALLWGANAETFEVVNEIEVGDAVAALIEWRKKGPLGKLHNVVEYIRKTPQRLDRFAVQVLQSYPEENVHTLKVGNITRWSSDYEAIQRALRLREAIDDFVHNAIRQNENGERSGSLEALQYDELLPEDWELLRCGKDILEPFKTWTNRLQVRYSNGCVADILPAMDELLSGLEKAKSNYQTQGSSAELIVMINNGWDVLNKYYAKTDVCPAYTVALALHPCMKLSYLRDEWQDRPDWIELAETTLQEVWETTYRGRAAAGGGGGMEAEHRDEAELADAGLNHWQRKRRARQREDHRDALEIFQAEPPVEHEAVTDVIGYWARKRSDPKWKDLAQMALEFLSIPAMSAEPERVFSGAKITISDRRCQLSDEAVNALECLKSWQRDGLISASHGEITELEDMLRALCLQELNGEAAENE